MEGSTIISHQQLYRSLLSAVKQLDEQKTSESLTELLAEEVQQKRWDFVRKCEYLIHQDDETISPKARVLLWRKAFYEPIAIAKRLVRGQIATLDELRQLEEFILGAIERLKVIFVTIEKRFDLNLKHLINLTIFGGDLGRIEEEVEHEDVPPTATRAYALDTAHALAISLGDLHRYYLDFSFPETLGSDDNGSECAAAFYFEAFKLNPKVGMPQNQLGTLLSGHNHNLDAIYHYFYALVCPVPFDLSDDNVTKLLLENANYLEHLDIVNEEDYQVTVRDFIARFILIADIFFYDRDVADFSGLCHALLMDLKWLLEEQREHLTSDMLYKIVSILFFCMIKLQCLQSDKVHHLNAFLLAICAQLLGSCIQRVEEFVQQREEQNTLFRETYMQLYEAYDRTVREARRERQKKTCDGTQKAASVSSYSDRNSLSVGGGSSQIEKGSSVAKENSKGKNKAAKLRRRRKRGNSTSSSESDLTSNFDSESELSDVSSALSDTDDEEEDENEAEAPQVAEKAATFNDFSMINLNGLTFNEVQHHAEDDDDVVVEEETIIFPPTGGENPQVNVEIAKDVDAPKKMKFKQKFHKVDPNIVVEFAQSEITLKAIKVLFDWLRNSREIVVSCHQTNPEFIHQTMTLLNHFNIDIFTSKVFFERQMLHVGGIRENLRALFDERLHIPIHEDMALKHLSLFVANQEQLDWEIASKLGVSECEENLLRLFKMLDFGFYICKTFKFNYVFCTKGRIFVENFLAKKKRRTKRAKGKQVDSKRRPARAQNGRPKSDASEEDVESGRKRGYLRSRNGGNVAENEEQRAEKKIDDGDKSQKYALMGKLWLRSEVKSLESKVRKPNGLHLTPYLMMDSKSLTEYQTAVKNLVKARKFVVLIPNAVLSELDELKKHSDRARNVIRWLEQEFSKGNRFLRSQRDHETLPLPLIKTPKKIDREASVFLQIAQFCNYIVTNQMNPDGSSDVVTLLTGENLVEKKCPHFSYYGILNSIPVKFDQIQGFYAKYRKK